MGTNTKSNKYKMKTVFLALVLLTAVSYSRNLPKDDCCDKLRKCCCGNDDKSSGGSSGGSHSGYQQNNVIVTTEPNTPTTEENYTTQDIETPQEFTTPKTEIDIEIECNCDDDENDNGNGNNAAGHVDNEIVTIDLNREGDCHKFACPEGQVSCQVQCTLDHGYYPDKHDPTGYCFCSGYEAPSRYERCQHGLVWSAEIKNCVWA